MTLMGVSRDHQQQLEASGENLSENLAASHAAQQGLPLPTHPSQYTERARQVAYAS